MNHQVKGRRLGRCTPHRVAMLRNMVTSLLDHEKIETTEARAKELRGYAEKIITLGKRGTLHARRQALEVVRSESVVKKVFDELAKRYQNRPGGYTRVIKISPRRGDNAKMGIIELVTETIKEKGKTRRSRRKAKVEGAEGAAGAAKAPKKIKTKEVAATVEAPKKIKAKKVAAEAAVADSKPAEESAAQAGETAKEPEAENKE